MSFVFQFKLHALERKRTLISITHLHNHI